MVFAIKSQLVCKCLAMKQQHEIIKTPRPMVNEESPVEHKELLK